MALYWIPLLNFKQDIRIPLPCFPFHLICFAGLVFVPILTTAASDLGRRGVDRHW